MRAQLRRELFPQPTEIRAADLSAGQMAEAVIRAAIATCELSQLAYRYEAALRGMCTLRARWVALAALAALHPDVAIPAISVPLGCGPHPLQTLRTLRQAAWWDEALVTRLAVDIAEPGQADPIDGFEDLRRALSALLDDRFGGGPGAGGCGSDNLGGGA